MLSALRARAVLVVSLCVTALCVAACTPRLHLSLIVRGGTVVPGDGREGFRADIGVAGDRIVAIGDLARESAPLDIDATGRMITPGFVDLQGPAAITALVDPTGGPYLRQGITTQVFGADGPAYWTPQGVDVERLQCLGVPVDWRGLTEYLDRLRARGPAFNAAVLTPLAVARASGSDVAAFVDAELQKGSFGVVAVGGDAPEDAAAAAGPVKRARGLLEISWDLVATGNQAWATLTPLAGRLLIGRSWASGTPAAVVYKSPLPAESLLFATVSPQATNDETLAEATRVRSRLIFTAASADARCDAAPPADRAAFPSLLRRAIDHPERLSLGAVVTHATVLAARQAGLDRRGAIVKDFFADLVIIDPRQVGEQPDGPAGIDYVIVNGVVTVSPKGLTGARAGAVLRHVPGTPIYEPW